MGERKGTRVLKIPYAETFEYPSHDETKIVNVNDTSTHSLQAHLSTHPHTYPPTPIPRNVNLTTSVITQRPQGATLTVVPAFVFDVKIVRRPPQLVVRVFE